MVVLPSIKVWLPAMKAKGLEISGTFSRRAGVIQMEMTLTNKAMSVMADFAIQFNKNRWEQVRLIGCTYFSVTLATRFLSSLSVASVSVQLVLFRFLLLSAQTRLLRRLFPSVMWDQS